MKKRKANKHGPQLLAIILTAFFVIGTLSGPVFGAQVSEDVGLPIAAESSEEVEKTGETDNPERAEEIEESVDNNDKSKEEGKTDTEDYSLAGDPKTDESGDTESFSESTYCPDPEEFAPVDSSIFSDVSVVEAEEESSAPDTAEENAGTSSSVQNDDFDSTVESSEKSPNTSRVEKSPSLQGSEEVIEAIPAEETVVTTEDQNNDTSDFLIVNGVLTEYNGEGGEVVVPDGVTSIGDYAFWHCSNLKSVRLPDSVISIGDCAFESCDNLTSITMPNSITSIGYDAFAYCNSLTSVILPDSLTTIETGLFNHCGNLTSITMPKNLASIGYDAFSYCSSLSSITLPNSLTKIEFGAFDECDNLTIYCSSNAKYIIEYASVSKIPYYGDIPFTISGSTLVSYNRSGGTVTVPDGIKVIGKSAFEDCWEVTKISLPAETEIIEESAFYGCSSLTSISLSGIKRIGRSAFSECTSLRSISIPEGITRVDDHLFENCNSLNNITLPNTLKSIGISAFASCSNLKSIIIPKSVIRIDGSCFSNCSSLTSISLPDGIEWISYGTFEGCSSLKSIVIPNGTDFISENAFSDCTDLTKITIPASVTDIEDFAFEGSFNVVIYCPSNAGQVIKYAKEWNIPYNTYSIPLTKITLSKTSTTLTKGQTFTITTSYTPDTATNKAVAWSSSNTKVVTVTTAGKITAVSKGTATITALAKDGSGTKASCTVNVLPVLKKPGNCRFVKWNNANYCSCNIAWNQMPGADGYQTLLSWTNGSHASTTTVKSNVLSRTCTVATNHVSQMKVRAYVKMAGKTYYSPWSNVVFITPSPAKLTTKNVSPSSKNLKMNISWNIVYGCNGYNVFITTNHYGTWYWNQSTSTKANATSAVITKYRGSKLKKNTRYYVRIVTRRQRNGVFCTVPMPSNNAYTGSFIIK